MKTRHLFHRKKENDWALLASRRGAAMTEYIIITMLIGVFSIGTVSVFGDNIRALFATTDNGLAGVDSTPATTTAKAELYNLKGIKGAQQAGQEAGSQAARTTALRAALNDPTAKVISSDQPLARKPGDHPMYPGVQFPGFEQRTVGFTDDLAFAMQEYGFRIRLAVEQQKAHNRYERQKAREEAAKQPKAERGANKTDPFENPFLNSL